MSLTAALDVTPAPPLLLTDTCDATASGTETASIRLANTGGSALDLCAHHFDQYGLALIQSGYAVVEDARARLRESYK